MQMHHIIIIIVCNYMFFRLFFDKFDLSVFRDEIHSSCGLWPVVVQFFQSSQSQKLRVVKRSSRVTQPFGVSGDDIILALELFVVFLQKAWAFWNQKNAFAFGCSW